MIKDIVVNLTLGAETDPACRYAISLAEAYNAHITGVAFAYEPPLASVDPGGRGHRRLPDRKGRPADESKRGG